MRTYHLTVVDGGTERDVTADNPRDAAEDFVRSLCAADPGFASDACRNGGVEVGVAGGPANGQRRWQVDVEMRLEIGIPRPVVPR